MNQERVMELAALADAFDYEATHPLSGMGASALQLQQAAHHLRAYAEQEVELAKWKLGCETNADCYREAVRAQDSQRLEIIALKDQLTQRDARIKELEACCAEMRELLQKSIDQVFSENTSFNRENRTAWIWRDVDKLLKATNCGKDLLAQHEAWRMALEEIEEQSEYGYPAGQVKPDGTFIPRTEWQTGWNAAMNKIAEVFDKYDIARQALNSTVSALPERS